MCHPTFVPTQSNLHHVRFSPEPTLPARHNSKAHRRGVSMDSFFDAANQIKDEYLALQNSPQSVVEERCPSTILGSSKRDWRQLLLPDLVGDAAARLATARFPSSAPLLSSSSSISRPMSRRSQSVIPSVPDLLPSSCSASFPASTSATVTRAKPSVSFSPNVTVREYNVTVGDVISPNYDGSMNSGLPLSLGWNCRTVKSSLVIPEEETANALVKDIYFQSNRKLRKRVEKSLYLSPKDRYAILREQGGYSEKELWKMQRELTLRDRQEFFFGGVSNE